MREVSGFDFLVDFFTTFLVLASIFVGDYFLGGSSTRSCPASRSVGRALSVFSPSFLISSIGLSGYCGGGMIGGGGSKFFSSIKYISLNFLG